MSVDFRKIRPSPILWEPFKFTAPTRHLIVDCAVRRIEIRLRLSFYIGQGLANARWKHSESIANGRINFFIVMFHLLLGKSAINAPLICKEIWKELVQSQMWWNVQIFSHSRREEACYSEIDFALDLRFLQRRSSPFKEEFCSFIILFHPNKWNYGVSVHHLPQWNNNMRQMGKIYTTHTQIMALITKTK